MIRIISDRRVAALPSDVRKVYDLPSAGQKLWGLRPLKVIFVFALVALFSSVSSAQTKPDKDYLIYVVSEAADKIALIRFGPERRADRSSG